MNRAKPANLPLLETKGPFQRRKSLVHLRERGRVSLKYETFSKTRSRDIFLVKIREREFRVFTRAPEVS